MGDETEMDNSPSAADERDNVNSRANSLGMGIGMLIAGGAMLANQLGWIKSVDWFVPAVLVGLAVSHLYNALKH
jgi:hypothetical protein